MHEFSLPLHAFNPSIVSVKKEESRLKVLTNEKKAGRQQIGAGPILLEA
jgi:hypothetical protein